MGRLVNDLLIIVGAYLVVFYALFPPVPVKGLFPSVPITPPDPIFIGVVSIVVGAVAVAVGIFSLVRGSNDVASFGLAVVGAYLLVLRFLYPSVPIKSTVVLTPSEPIIVWLSLGVGLVAVVFGIVRLFWPNEPTKAN